MTSRERLIAAARGGEVDRRPTLVWPGHPADSDALVVSSPSLLPAAEGVVRLVEVVNPFGRAAEEGVDLNAALDADPASGNARLDAYVEATREAIQAALTAGADGILYRLHGARAEWCSPMQYGGFYLERDRELLSEIQDATLNVLYIVGNDDVYLDFVSDLPAHVFAWDRDASGFDAAYVRTLRQGAQASSDPASEIALPGARIADQLEPALRNAHV